MAPAAPNMSLVDKVSTTLAPSKGKELWQMGLKENWPELDTLLQSSGLESMWITDAATEKCFQIARQKFDSSKDEQKRGILHTLVGTKGGDNADLLRRLLALGLEPDSADGGCRPTHFFAFACRPLCAEVLCPCRPDLAAKDRRGQTPADTADHYLQAPAIDEEKKKALHMIQYIFKYYTTNGFPCLAKLACDKNWHALKNLCRRKVVILQEVLALYKDKDAVEWAKFHGEHKLAEEICYLFGYPTSALNAASNSETGGKQHVSNGLSTVSDNCLASLEDTLKNLAAKFGDHNNVGPVGGSAKNVEDSAVTLRELQGIRDEVKAVRGLVAQLVQNPSAASSIEGSTVSGQLKTNKPILAAIDALLGELRRRAVSGGMESFLLSELAAVAEKFDDE